MVVVVGGCDPLEQVNISLIICIPYICHFFYTGKIFGEQGNYSLRRPPKLIIPKTFTKQRWATVYGFMCNHICKSKQAYMTRAKVMSSLRDKINQKLLTFKRTPSP